MSPEERDIRAVQAEGYPAGLVNAGIGTVERCWFYLHTSGVAPQRCHLRDGHPETPGVKGRGHVYDSLKETA